jgi:hypothetical protein
MAHLRFMQFLIMTATVLACSFLLLLGVLSLLQDLFIDVSYEAPVVMDQNMNMSDRGGGDAE